VHAGFTAVAAAVCIVMPIAASAQAPAAPDPADLLTVLNAALYPVEVMAYCYGKVAPDPAYQAAGGGWVTRNGELFGKVEALATAAKVSNDARVQADRQTLADIEKVVASQPDAAAYCTLIAGIVNAGQFDLTIRADLQPALKRIFPAS
jgi:hypothetical protein